MTFRGTTLVLLCLLCAAVPKAQAAPVDRDPYLDALDCSNILAAARRRVPQVFASPAIQQTAFDILDGFGRLLTSFGKYQPKPTPELPSMESSGSNNSGTLTESALNADFEATLTFYSSAEFDGVSTFLVDYLLGWNNRRLDLKIADDNENLSLSISTNDGRNVRSTLLVTTSIQTPPTPNLSYDFQADESGAQYFVDPLNRIWRVPSRSELVAAAEIPYVELFNAATSTRVPLDQSQREASIVHRYMGERMQISRSTSGENILIATFTDERPDTLTTWTLSWRAAASTYNVDSVNFPSSSLARNQFNFSSGVRGFLFYGQEFPDSLPIWMQMGGTRYSMDTTRLPNFNSSQGQALQPSSITVNPALNTMLRVSTHVGLPAISRAEFYEMGFNFRHDPGEIFTANARLIGSMESSSPIAAGRPVLAPTRNVFVILPKSDPAALYEDFQRIKFYGVNSNTGQIIERQTIDIPRDDTTERPSFVVTATFSADSSRLAVLLASGEVRIYQVR